MKKKYTPTYLSPDEFKKRFAKIVMFVMLIFTFSLSIGILGYHYIVDLSWIDSFLNAAMILGGMGEINDLTNFDDKLFAGAYALFSGAAFLTSMGIFLSPLLHRLLQRFHMESGGDDEDK